MNRRSFVFAAAAPLVAAAFPRSLQAAQAGGGTVALVTADLEAHLVAVETTTGRIVKRIATAPGPRSIESNAFGQALVAHTTQGRLSVVDAATLSVVGEIGGLGQPRYTAMHPSERIAYVSDSKRGEVAVVDLVRREVVRRVGVPGPARHLSLSGDGALLWTALGTKAERVAVLDLRDATRPRLVRTFATPFLAHDVVFSPDGSVWVTSGSERRIAVYDARGRGRPRLLAADAAPQHVAFAGTRAFVASGDDGIVRFHRRDGSLLGLTRVPVGSYNVTVGGERIVTPSLGQGTVALLDPHGNVRRLRRIARSAHDACVVASG